MESASSYMRAIFPESPGPPLSAHILDFLIKLCYNIYVRKKFTHFLHPSYNSGESGREYGGQSLTLHFYTVRFFEGEFAIFSDARKNTRERELVMFGEIKIYAPDHKSDKRREKCGSRYAGRIKRSPILL